mmetsp:Transcript_450/g.635  ORF Transcript_450/g.635 Transcript_450/m.635 type:complete len:218 (-) Transcript_450:450-1103(-)
MHSWISKLVSNLTSKLQTRVFHCKASCEVQNFLIVLGTKPNSRNFCWNYNSVSTSLFFSIIFLNSTSTSSLTISLTCSSTCSLMFTPATFNFSIRASHSSFKTPEISSSSSIELSPSESNVFSREAMKDSLRSIPFSSERLAKSSIHSLASTWRISIIRDATLRGSTPISTLLLGTYIGSMPKGCLVASIDRVNRLRRKVSPLTSSQLPSSGMGFSL